MKIGVFDSGVGGWNVARAIELARPDDTVLFVDDKVHVPYGTKPIEEIYGYVLPILHNLVVEGCEVIVIACNTVTTNLIARLRNELSVPFIGMEPMIKPAALLSKNKIITVCATPKTLESERYQWLKQTYADGIKVYEPDCTMWSRLIEDTQMDESTIRNAIEPTLASGSDVVVLGCTHYHWIEDKIKDLAAGRAIVLQPEEPVISELQRVIAQLQK